MMDSVNYFTIYRKDDVNQRFLITKNKLAVDLSTVQEITIPLLKDDSSCLYANKSDGKIVVGSNLGTLFLVLSTSDTQNLQVTTQPIDVDIVVRGADSKTQTYRCPSCLLILERTC